jgi:hypothetical protein
MQGGMGEDVWRCVGKVINASRNVTGNRERKAPFG